MGCGWQYLRQDSVQLVHGHVKVSTLLDQASIATRAASVHETLAQCRIRSTDGETSQYVEMTSQPPRAAEKHGWTVGDAVGSGVAARWHRRVDPVTGTYPGRHVHV